MQELRGHDHSEKGALLVKADCSVMLSGRRTRPPRTKAVGATITRGYDMKIGYVRVSTEEQRVDLQCHALKNAGCARIFCDHGISGRTLDRPGLGKALRCLKPGDTLVVWRLDRLGRSLIGLVQLIDTLGKREVEFISLSEAIDTSSSGGRLVFHMMAALSEFERSLISERTRAGMAAAKSSGRRIGRPPALSREDVKRAHKAIYQDGEDLAEVASRHKVSVKTLKHWVEEYSARKGITTICDP